MKYLKRGIFVCFLCLFGIFLLAVTENDKKIHTDYEKRFVLVAPLKWPFIPDGIKAADQEFKTNTRLTGSDNLDLEAQIRGIENAVRAEADGIITACSSVSEDLEKAIRKARNAGIPVILIDGDMPESGRNCYIGTNNTESGRMAGDDMVNATGGTAKIAVVTSDMNSSNQKERVDGFLEVCEKHPDMEIVEILECHSDSVEIVEKLSNLLEEKPEINALYLTEALSGTVVGKIIQAREKPMTVVAFDALASTMEYLKEGVYDSIIQQSMYQEGYLAVQNLCRILNGEKVEDSIYTEAISITSENYMKYDIEDYGEFAWYDN